MRLYSVSTATHLAFIRGRAASDRVMSFQKSGEWQARVHYRGPAGEAFTKFRANEQLLLLASC